MVLNADPTIDIRNSDKVDKVMLGGRLYDATTLSEVATGTYTRKPYWWEGATGANGSGARLTSGHGHGDWTQD